MTQKQINNMTNLYQALELALSNPSWNKHYQLKEPTVEKLIRDTIPDLPGFSGTVRTADQSELSMLLSKKLQEECDEAIAEILLTEPGKSTDALIAELADVLEVVRGIAYNHNICLTQIQTIAEEKRAARGGFERGIVLVKPSDK